MPQAYVQTKTVARMQHKGQGAPYLGPGFASYLRIMEDVYGRRPFRLEQGHMGSLSCKGKGRRFAVWTGGNERTCCSSASTREDHKWGHLTEGKEHYELIGEAYASGITDDERWHQELPRKARRFEIG